MFGERVLLNNISLRFFLPLGFVIIALVVLISYYLVALPIGYEVAIRNAEVSFSRKLASFQGRYNNLLSTDNVIAVNQDLMMTAQEDYVSISNILILDQNDVVLYSSDMSQVGYDAVELPFRFNTIQNNRARTSGLVYFERGSGRSLIGYAGISYFNEQGPQQNSLVVLLDTTASAQQSLEVTFSTLAIVLTALLFVGALYVILLHYKIHDRVNGLLSMAREIGRTTHTGDYEVKGKDELAQIGTELEHMASLLSLREGHLQAMRYQAEKVSENKSRFLSTMSHEIRTPLTGLIGFIELALLKFEDQDDENYLNISLQSANSLLLLVNEILDLSRLENNRVIVDAVDVNLKSFLERILSSQRAFAHQRGLEIELDYMVQDVETVKFDSKLLGQVLLNLISNAIKFTEYGKVTLKASLHKGKGSSFDLEIQVVDTGIGIPEQQIPRLFNRFEQIDEDQDKASHYGTGLGLSIVKEISRLMNIHIDVKSTMGFGTAFTLKMKVLEGNPETVIRRKKQPIKKKSRDKYDATIMIVDDNHINRLLLSQLVSEKATRNIVLESGEAAIEYMKKIAADEAEKIDAILMDINMPGMNGDEAQVKIRELHPDFIELPIIAVTANTVDGAKESLLKSGLTAFISKPINQDEMSHILDQHLKDHAPLVLSDQELKANIKQSSNETLDFERDKNEKTKENALSNLLSDL